MESNDALDVFAALSQRTRLDAFRLIVGREPDGVAAGDVARLLGVPQNTISTHLAILARAGLVSSTRSGRSIAYRAEIGRVREIASFLVSDCCGGRPELCGPLVTEFAPCCTSQETKHGR